MHTYIFFRGNKIKVRHGQIHAMVSLCIAFKSIILKKNRYNNSIILAFLNYKEDIRLINIYITDVT